VVTPRSQAVWNAATKKLDSEAGLRGELHSSGAEKNLLEDGLQAVWSETTSTLDKKFDGGPGCFSGVAIKHRKLPEPGPPTKTY